ncbi:MAG: TatD family hydrolase, partial [Sedimenticola sp.]
MAEATKEKYLLPAEKLVWDLGHVRSMTTEVFVAITRGQYELAVQRQFSKWIRDFQVECKIFLSVKEILEYFRNPYGSDAVHIPRPKQIATSRLVSEGHLVQDVRLRTANLPKMVSDSAIVVEDIPPHEYVDASSKSEHVGAPNPTRSHGRPHALGLRSPARRQSTMESYQPQELDRPHALGLRSPACRQSTMESYQPQELDRPRSRRSPSPERWQSNQPRIYRGRSPLTGLGRSQGSPPHLQPHETYSVRDRRPRSRSPRWQPRGKSQGYHRPHSMRRQPGTHYEEPIEPLRPHVDYPERHVGPTRSTTSDNQCKVTAPVNEMATQTQPDCVSVAIQTDTAPCRCLDILRDHFNTQLVSTSIQSAGDLPEPLSASPQCEWAPTANLKVCTTADKRVVEEVAFRETSVKARVPSKRRATSPISISTIRESDGDVKRKKHNKRKCPVDDCTYVTHMMKRHVQNVHIPGLFHDAESPQMLENPKFHNRRLLGLRTLAKFVIGEEGTVQSLVNFVNHNLLLDPLLTVTASTHDAMDRLCDVAGWERPGSYTLGSLNSPACLIHWRVMGFLMSRITGSEPDIMFRRFSPVWRSGENSGRYQARPNLPRRRKTYNRLYRDQPPSGRSGSEKEQVQVPSATVSSSVNDRVESRPPTPKHADSAPLESEPQAPSALFALADDELLDYEDDMVISPARSRASIGPSEEENLLIETSDIEMLDLSPVPSRVNKADIPVVHTGTPSDQSHTLVPNSRELSPTIPSPIIPPVAGPSTPRPRLTLTSSGGVAVTSPGGSPMPASKLRSYALVLASAQSPSIGVVRPQKSPPKVNPGRANDEAVVFDSHFHLDRLAKRLGHNMSDIETIVNMKTEVLPQTVATLSGGVFVFCDPDTWSRIPLVCEPGWTIAVGVHPKNVPSLYDRDITYLKQLLQRPNVSALGEIGLDYSMNPSTWEAQREFLGTALTWITPGQVLVLHVRGDESDYTATEAYNHCLEIVQKYCVPDQRIHLHCFSGNSKCLNSWKGTFPNCFFSFAGKVRRFNNAQREALRRVPIDRLLVETDSPYLPVLAGLRTSTPAYTGDVANAVASIRREPFRIIAEATTN